MSLLEQPVEIALADYGMGNRRSVEKAFEHIGAHVSVTSDPDALRAAAGVVVPGVGAFPRGMAALRELGLDDLLRELVAQGRPVLGICLGMQLGFERSTEQGGATGLGLIEGEVRELPRSGTPSGAPAGPHGELKLPHIGWNEVSFSATASGAAAVLVAGLTLLRNFVRICAAEPAAADAVDAGEPLAARTGARP